MTTNRCNKCGETVSDIDAGFSPGLHAMKHSCGGIWEQVEAEIPTNVGSACMRCGSTQFSDGYCSGCGSYLLPQRA